MAKISKMTAILGTATRMGQGWGIPNLQGPEALPDYNCVPFISVKGLKGARKLLRVAMH